VSEAIAAQALRLERWYCPDCDRLLRKPPFRNDVGERHHSWRCRSPMVSAVVYIVEAKPGV
jgi:hypothetical protein